MNLSLIILKSGQYIIAQSEELDYEPKVHLTNAYEVSGTKNTVLSKWPLFTDDEHILLHSESLLTVCEPSADVVKSYLRKTGLKEKDLTQEPKQVILSEETNAQVIDPVPATQEDLFYDDEEYEPRYIEE